MTDTTHEAWREVVADDLYDPDGHGGTHWSVERVDAAGDDVEFYTAAELTSREAPRIEPDDHPGFAAGSIAVHRSSYDEYRVYPAHTGPAPDDDGSQYDEVDEIRFHTFPARPMYNGLWPLRSAGRWEPDELWQMARALAPLPLALVVDADLDVTGLALTGAGSDHRWQLAVGFVALGFLPPPGLGLESDRREHAVEEIGEDRADAVLRAYVHGLDVRAARLRRSAHRARAMLPTP